MTIAEMILLSLSLCMDTAAVSVSGSTALGKIGAFRALCIALMFCVMHIIMLAAGFFLGSSVVSYVGKFSDVIAFLLLAYIGGSMIADSLRKGCAEKQVDLSGIVSLAAAAAAVSIDASAVGVSLAMASVPYPEMYAMAAVLFAVTLLCSFTGIIFGSRIGVKFGRPACLAGGLVLIAIGIRILVA